jgi:hypothetical protein
MSLTPDPKAAPPDFWVCFRLLPSDVPADVRLRAALKTLLRRYRLRAVEIRDVPPADEPLVRKEP